MVDGLDGALQGLGRHHGHATTGGGTVSVPDPGDVGGGSFFGDVASPVGDSGAAGGGSFFESGGIAENSGSAGGGSFFDAAADDDSGAATGAVFADLLDSTPAEAAPVKGGGMLDGLGDLGDVDGDGIGAIVALVALAAILLVVLGAGAYLIWAAPDILAEAAFQLALPWLLRRRSARIDSPEWVGSILKATWVPFLVVLVLVGGIGFGLEVAFPGARTIVDVQHYDTLPARPHW